VHLVAKAKKLKPQDVVPRMEVLFELLDKAKLAPATILKTEAQKEHYETLLMFAFRKQQAARYHRDRVDELLTAKQEETENHLAKSRSATMPSSRLNAVHMTMKISKTANEFIYELSAFYAAIRSSIDFLARLLGEHSKAIEVGSITTFLKFVKSGKVGPTVDVVAKHTIWLVHLQDYRDYLVHRLVIGATSGGQREWKNGQWINTAYPIAVPAETPKHVPDTRLFRAMKDPESNFDIFTSEASITYPDGMTKMIERTVEMTPRDGYIRIEKLMGKELNAFDAFFGDVVDALIHLKFEPATIGSNQP
jgi:hypothetical protein